MQKWLCDDCIEKREFMTGRVIAILTIPNIGVNECADCKKQIWDLSLAEIKEPKR